MKLLRFLSDLNCTIDDVLTLESDNEQTLYWYVYAAFFLHAAMKIHTGYVFYLVKVMVVADYTERKVNVRILT